MANPPEDIGAGIIAANENIALIRRLRLASFMEATTLLTLVLVAVPLKHLLGLPVATRIMGPVHGAAFIFYVWSVIVTVSGNRAWSRGEKTRLILAAFVPFGGFANAALLRRKQEDAREGRY